LCVCVCACVCVCVLRPPCHQAKLKEAEKLDQVDWERDQEAAHRARLVKRRRKRQAARREVRNFSRGFAASQNLATRHITAGLQKRREKAKKAEVTAKVGACMHHAFVLCCALHGRCATSCNHHGH